MSWLQFESELSAYMQIHTHTHNTLTSRIYVITALTEWLRSNFPGQYCMLIEVLGLIASLLLSREGAVEG